MKQMQAVLTLLIGIAMTLLPGCNLSDTPTSPDDTKLSETPLNNSGDAGIAFSYLPDTWRDAVYREICFALSQQRYNAGPGYWGTSTKTVDGCFAGDWNYMGLGIGKGGQCKSFAQTIVSRATGARYSLPSGYSYATGDIRWCRPGDVIQGTSTNGVNHTAIVFQVLARDSQGGATLIDVIDSNFVGGFGGELIGRHKLPTSSFPLSRFKVW